MAVDQSQIPARFKSQTSLFDIHANGKVVVAGHRVPVFVVMEALREAGKDPVAELGSQFPSIDKVLLENVIAFLTEHGDELDDFYQSEKALAEQVFEEIADKRTGPNLSELRERRRKRLDSSNG